MYIKIIFIFLTPFLLVAQILSAQSFSEASGTPFHGVSFGSIAFVDIEGDNDQDVLITNSQTKLYTNDGQGNFSVKFGTPFKDVSFSSSTIADVDGDNDQDILITGKASFNDSPDARLYKNDGQGNFSEVTGTPFAGVKRGSTTFLDVDGDNDQDLLITGDTSSIEPFTKLYTNDGQGNFSEASGNSFEDVLESSIAFADVDGDNDQDILLTGENSSFDSVAKLYINDGQGNFSEVPGTPFEGVEKSSIGFVDVDGDNDQDVILTGQNNSDNPISKLYINDGQGNFSETTGTSFQGVAEGSIAFADVDVDNDQDVLITGSSDTGSISKLYTNNGQGNFSEVTGIPFEDVVNSSIGFADVDKDNDPDVLITGDTSLAKPISKLYINETDVSSTDDLNSGASIDVMPYPNPIKGKHLHVRYNASENGDVQVKVYGMKGKLVKQQKEFTGTGQQSLSIDLPSLAQGSYILELQQGKRRGYAKFSVH